MENNNEKSNKKLHLFDSIYKCGKCKLVSKKHKEHMIKNDMLNLVVKHIHLFDD